MSRTVTAGLDGSAESVAAADWAAREALLRSLPLRLVHAGDQPPYGYVPFAGETVAPPDVDRAASMLHEVGVSLTRRHPGLLVTSGRPAGRPAVALTEAASEAEVLVLGSRGLGRAAGHLLGSVASAVVARAEQPVVLVRVADERRPDDAGTATAFPADPYRDVAVGLDLHDPPADTVLEFAFDAAARRGGTLRVIHGWSPSATRAGRGPEEPDVEHGELLTDALRPWREKFPQVEVAEEPVIGTAGAHLVDASHHVSLVVVGRGRRSAPLGPRIGPVTHQVLREAVAPVAVVPHD
ncbi:universal stress protein [Streptomyces lincolnensis]|uniref:universal stress protein n=1 Tax=Streptomyces lincolnensis TaxID=1915 RepID=UPI001E4A4740|nr:universal stress protein [Streptomyces lincolnensis]MCD7442286.1 universal stress protein [Streptomyces lincolnensis]